jgi:hypothetical protein
MQRQLMNVYASDWKFKTVLEFHQKIDPQYHASGLRLFIFQSNSQSIGAFVSFYGQGSGIGLKFSIPNAEFADIALTVFENFEKFAKPSIGSNIRITLPRKKVPESSLTNLTHHYFSLSDLDGSSGSLTSAGTGMGVGVGGSYVTAERSGSYLFTCSNLGIEFGRLGLSFDALRGFWKVLYVWEF